MPEMRQVSVTKFITTVLSCASFVKVLRGTYIQQYMALVSLLIDMVNKEQGLVTKKKMIVPKKVRGFCAKFVKV